LHAPDNALRDRLVPVNRKYPLETLIAACREYSRETGRRVTFEYILFQDINDSMETATALARLLDGLDCHVNLICPNPTSSKAFRQPAPGRVRRFQQELHRRGINVTLRQSLGTDIEAGCGQLRSRYLKGQLES
ncbi:MAG: 23S rRNA (adenine(2503)-C(2))-methyltransferase RlmN, partial [Dehalococcoidia bacterium]|nr:23S rRNA (adenine(2503)-C(2))-methyltransferase RlmN [Dehalococcoidia bacterium]